MSIVRSLVEMHGGRVGAASDGNGNIWFVSGAEHAPRKMYADVEVLSGNKVSDSKPIRTAVQGAAAVWTPDTGTCVFGGSTDPPPLTAIRRIRTRLDGRSPRSNAWRGQTQGGQICRRLATTLARRSSIAPSTSWDRDIAYRAWLVAASQKLSRRCGSVDAVI